MKVTFAFGIGLILHVIACPAPAQQNNATQIMPPNEEGSYSNAGYLPPKDAVHLVLSIEHRRMFGPGYKSFTEGRLGGEMIENDHHGLSAFIFGGAIELKEHSSAHDAAHDPAVVGFGLGYRYYFTRQHTFVRPYLAVEGQFLWMAWKYQDPIVFDDETIRYDSTEGAERYLGFGLILGSNRFMNVFAEIGAGGGCFVGETSEGLNNDIFHPYAYVGVRAGLTFWF